MAKVSDYINKIKNAVYGKEVRASIANGIDVINKEVESTTGKQDHLEKTFDNLVINSGNSNAEIVDARVDKNSNTTYKKIGDRLDNVSSQLEKKAEVKDARMKADKINSSDLNTTSDDVKIKPKNLSLEVKEMMAGTTLVAPEPSKFSINREHINILSTDILAEKKIISENIFNKKDILVGYLLDVNNGIPYSRNPVDFVSNFIMIDANIQYTTNANQPCFYESDGSFISFSETQTFTTPSNAKFLRISGSTEYLNNYSVMKGATASIEDYVYTFQGLASSDETRDRLAVIDRVTSILDTIEDIRITQNGLNLVVELIGNNNYFNSFYIYKNNKYEKVIKTATKDVEFTLSSWQSLVLDLNTNQIVVKSENEILGSSNHVVLITQSSYGNGINGFLAEKFALLKSKKIQKDFNTEVKIDDLYFKLDYPTITLKFSKILIAKGSFYKEFTYSKLKADIDVYYFIKNSEWVDDCLMLPNGFLLTYDMNDDKFKVATLGNYSEFNQILICYNDNGTCQGLISGTISTGSVKKLNIRETHIDTSYLNDIKNKENEILSNLEDEFVFGLCADTHVENVYGGVPNLVKLIMNRTCEVLNADCIMNCGDSVSYGKQDKSLSIDDLKNAVNGYNLKSKLLHTVGNHDFNGVSGFDGFDGKERRSWLITKKELYNIVQKHLEKDKDVHFGSKEDLYFYKDFEDKKIRVIVLNTSDLTEIWENDNDGKGDYLKYTPLLIGGVRQKQLDWLNSTALNFSDKTKKKEWHTLVLCHIGLYTPDEGLTWNAPVVENMSVVREIIANFVSGTDAQLNYTDSTYEGMFTSSVTTSFSSQGAMEFIGVFSGHNHLDRVVKDGNLNQISTTAGYPDHTISNVDVDVVRIPLEYSEFAFDIVKINKKTKTIKMYRFGQGEDRKISY